MPSFTQWSNDIDRLHVPNPSVTCVCKIYSYTGISKYHRYHSTQQKQQSSSRFLFKKPQKSLHNLLCISFCMLIYVFFHCTINLISIYSIYYILYNLYSTCFKYTMSPFHFCSICTCQNCKYKYILRNRNRII